MKTERIVRRPRLAGLAGAAVVLAVGAVTGVATLAGARTAATAHSGTARAAAQNVITTLDPSTTTSVQATIGSDGLPVVAYLTGPVRSDGTPIDPRTLKLAHCSNANCTSATIRTLAANAGQQAGFTSFSHTVIGIAIGTDGFPLITYYKWDTKDLAVVHCNDVTCTTWTRRSIATTGDVGRDSSVTIAPAIYPYPDHPSWPVIPAGPVIAYYGATNGTLMVIRCSDPACALTKTTRTLDTAGNQGALTSIATSVDGTPIIAYRAVTNAGASWQLRTVYCGTDYTTSTTKACNKPVKTALDTVAAGDNIFATSIVIGSDGLPFIGSHIGVAHCGNPQCTAATVTNTLSQIGTADSVAVDSDHLPMFVGPIPAGPKREWLSHCVSVVCRSFVTADVTKTNWGYPSVTLGADGLPFIAFTGGFAVGPGADTTGLSVAHCANEFCSTLFRRR